MQTAKPPATPGGVGEQHGSSDSGSHKLREAYAHSNPRPTGLSFRLDADLSDRLRRAALARRWSPEALAAQLVSRGLEQEALSARSRATLAMLTPRELQVTRLTARGQTNHKIAFALAISPETVKSHIRSTLAKFGLRSKAELRLLLRELGDWDSET